MTKLLRREMKLASSIGSDKARFLIRHGERPQIIKNTIEYLRREGLNMEEVKRWFDDE